MNQPSPYRRPISERIKAVVFDLDGLMFNTEEVFEMSGRELLRRRGLELTREIHVQMMGRRAKESFAALVNLTGLTESIEELIAESEEIFRELLDDTLAPMPGLFELLDRIERNALPKGVATSSSRPYLENILGRFDLLDRFDMLLTAEDVAHGKPHPEIYLTAAARLGVAPESMLVLEDSETGTRAAVAANAFAVSVPHRHSAAHDFAGAAYVADGLHDPNLLRLIGK